MKTCLVVDGNSLAWRAHHAVGYLSTQGAPTGMVFGFLNSLQSCLEAVVAKDCWVCWDDGKSRFRMDLFPEYKIRRLEKADPVGLEQFRLQQLALKELLPLLGVRQVSCRGWEADDLIGLQAVKSTPSSKRLVILSGDRDMYQLVRPGVSVMPPTRKLITLETFSQLVCFPKSKQPVPSPQKWFWFRVLTGDSSDGIPGVGGIGDKRGQELVLAGWPKTGNNAIGSDWYIKKKTLIERNIYLMDLFFAGRLLSQQLAQDSVRGLPGLQEIKATPSLDLARKALAKLEMNDFLARWPIWSSTFRRLR